MREPQRQPHPVDPTLVIRDGAWRGSFAGLGTVAVESDGTVRVHPDAPDDDGQLEQALLRGWGELLASTRRGFALALGACVTPDDAATRGLLVGGDAHDVAFVVLALAHRGWHLLADRPTPTTWHREVLIAHPRAAPFVIHERMAVEAGLPGAPVRRLSNAVAVDVPRTTVPVAISAFVHVQRRRPDEEPFTDVTGRRRFELAATLMLRGALSPERESLVDEHLRLAALPWSMLRIEGTDVDLDQLLAWWSA